MNSLLRRSALSQSVQCFSRVSVTTAFALMLLSLLSLTSVHPAYAAEGGSNLRAQLLALINQERAAQNLPAYVENTTLSQAAYDHSSKMAAAGQTNTDTDTGQRISGAGIQATAWGENVGYSSPNPDAWGGVQVVHKNMMAQQAPNDNERKSLLSTTFNQIGIGIVIDANGVVWVTEDFVQTQTPAPAGNNPVPAPGGNNPAPAPAPASSDTLRQQLFALINQDRAAQGLPAYIEKTTLSQGAYDHSNKMAQMNTLAHQLPGEEDPGQRITKEDPQLTAWGENVGYSPSQPDAWGGAQVVHKSMMAEQPPNDGHRQNLLSSNFTQIGIGIVVDDKGVVWVTEDFVK